MEGEQARVSSQRHPRAFDSVLLQGVSRKRVGYTQSVLIKGNRTEIFKPATPTCCHWLRTIPR